MVQHSLIFSFTVNKEIRRVLQYRPLGLKYNRKTIISSPEAVRLQPSRLISGPQQLVGVSVPVEVVVGVQSRVRLVGEGVSGAFHFTQVENGRIGEGFESFAHFLSKISKSWLEKNRFLFFTFVMIWHLCTSVARFIGKSSPSLTS